MPGKPWPIIFLIQEFKRISGRRWWLAPVLTAAGMVTAAAILMLVIAGGLGSVPYGQNNRPSAGLAELKEPVLNQEAPAAVAPVPVKREGEKRQGGAETPRQPLAGTVKLEFGWQLHPLYKDWRYHAGTDIGATAGSPVYAIYSGEVHSIYEDRQYGLTVVVRSGVYTVYYGTLEAVAVAAGERVASGKRIGSVGLSGSEPYPHLHLAIKKGDNYINPREVLSKAE
jgi:murein DD-endopeptidase MepM/ murein hydrolase activator NlpD